MKKFLKLITIFTLVIVGAVAANRSEKINFVSTAQAVGDLTINWGVPSGDPIFNIPNFLPGDEETATVIISNGGTSNRSLGLRIADVTDLQNLSSQIDLVIKENGIEIFNATLSDLIAQATEPGFLQFDILPPSTSATYDFFASFNPGAGDEYQGTSVIFDIIIGIAFDLPEACRDIESSFNGQIIFGTSKKENLNGTPRNDIILAFEGDDKVEGNSGNDCILGGPGNDRLNGNNGQDVIFGD